MNPRTYTRLLEWPWEEGLRLKADIVLNWLGMSPRARTNELVVRKLGACNWSIR